MFEFFCVMLKTFLVHYVNEIEEIKFQEIFCFMRD